MQPIVSSLLQPFDRPGYAIIIWIFTTLQGRSSDFVISLLSFAVYSKFLIGDLFNLILIKRSLINVSYYMIVVWFLMYDIFTYELRRMAVSPYILHSFFVLNVSCERTRISCSSSRSCQALFLMLALDYLLSLLQIVIEPFVIDYSLSWILMQMLRIFIFK